MKNRDNIGALIEGLQRDHGLLAAYLEATDRIDWRALHKRVVIGESTKPSNVEAHQSVDGSPTFGIEAGKYTVTRGKKPATGAYV